MIFPPSFIILWICASDFCIFWFIGLLRDLVFGLFISSAIFLIYSWLHTAFIFIKSILLSWLVLFYCLQLNFMPSSHSFCYEWLLLIDTFRYSTIFPKLFQKYFFLWFPGFRDFYIVLLLHSFSSFLIKKKERLWSCSVVWFFATPQARATRLLCPWDFPGKSTGVGCHFLLQGIFWTQGLNPGLPCCRQKRFTIWATREEIR